MTFHESTITKLRLALAGHQDQLALANERVEKRTQALADAQEELGYAVEKAAVLRANVADCEQWLDFAALCDADNDLAHAFANAVLNRDAEMQAARDDAADDAMSASERFEHDQDAEARLDAAAAVWFDVMAGEEGGRF